MARKRRSIVALKKAELLGERPPFIPPPHAKGAALAGLRYEKKVAEYLKARYGEKRVWHGPWFEYEDKHGRGWCSPDLLVFPTGFGPVVIGEVKLTVTGEAERQLRKLYIPVVQHLWPNNVIRPVQISANLRPSFEGELVSFEDAIEQVDTEWEYSTIRWRPR